MQCYRVGGIFTVWPAAANPSKAYRSVKPTLSACTFSRAICRASLFLCGSCGANARSAILRVSASMGLLALISYSDLRQNALRALNGPSYRNSHPSWQPMMTFAILCGLPALSNSRSYWAIARKMQISCCSPDRQTTPMILW